MRTTSSVPQRRQVRSGRSRRIGSQVKNEWPSAGKRTPRAQRAGFGQADCHRVAILDLRPARPAIIRGALGPDTDAESRYEREYPNRHREFYGSACGAGPGSRGPWARARLRRGAGAPRRVASSSRRARRWSSSGPTAPASPRSFECSRRSFARRRASSTCSVPSFRSARGRRAGGSATWPRCAPLRRSQRWRRRFASTRSFTVSPTRTSASAELLAAGRPRAASRPARPHALGRPGSARRGRAAASSTSRSSCCSTSPAPTSIPRAMGSSSP